MIKNFDDYIKNIDELNLIGEIWKPIDKYDGKYLVSNYGRIKSIMKKEKPIIIKVHKARNGYIVFSAHYKQTIKKELVHRFVAKYFVENKNDYNEVNHIDGNKENNNVQNLEWSTRSLNNLHAFRTGLRKNAKYGDCLMSKKVYQYDLQGNFIKEWGSSTEAADYYGIYPSGIIDCANRKHETCAKYIWRYYKKDKIDNSNYLKTLPKKVYQYDLQGKLIKVWNSAKDAANYFKIDKSCINDCARGKTKTSMGYIWKK